MKPFYNTWFNKIRKSLFRIMAADRLILRRRIRNLEKSFKVRKSEMHLLEQMKNIESLYIRFAEKKSMRKSHLPILKYPSDLPIMTKKNQIVEAIKSHPVVIVSGETGSGKTTQIPKFCLEAGRGVDGMIGCTQPRRIAAISISHRIAEELEEEPGKSVGYKIRFNDQTGPQTFIKLMTDGILLAEAHSDPDLIQYDTIIIDEAHERNLNIDFLLGILKKLLPKRNGLKLIISSATIDTDKFSKSFENAPVIDVSGRLFPVEVRYAPNLSLGPGNEELTHIDLAVSAVEKIMRETFSGDILLFMPTEQDIRDSCTFLEDRFPENTMILPLYARLPAEAQKRVFSKIIQRKIIVATNIAETSITIPGIRYVIDTGLARLSYYSPSSKTTSLPVLPISRSSADQRKGRCGRVENGICIRLFSEEEYHLRPLYTPPEILRSNLAEVILRMIAFKMGDIYQFPFIDAPSKKSIRDGYELLIDLGAIEKRKSSADFILTKNGRLMADIPVDPKISRMIIEAIREKCLNEILIIGAAMSIQNPEERSPEKEDEIRERRKTFEEPSSDFMTLLNIWNACYGKRNEKKGISSLKKFCKRYALSFRRMREWQDVYEQLKGILQEIDFPIPSDETRDSSSLYEAIHKSILSGFLSNIAVKKEKNIYKAAKQTDVMIFPGSVLFNKGREWIVAGEIIETSRRFARTVALIDSSWLERIGQRQCRYSHRNPHWSKETGQVMVWEQVRLFGLVIEPGRLVPFASIDPEEATSIFIRQAIMGKEMKENFSFLVHNRIVQETIATLENKFRKKDLWAGDEAIFSFYKNRLRHVFDQHSLMNAIKEAGSDEFLRMKIEDVIIRTPSHEEVSRFPDTICISGKTYTLSYRFNPGAEDDGITLSIPLPMPSQIRKESLEYLVPGLLRDKVEMLIKGLPREYRKKLIPISIAVDAVLSQPIKKDKPILNWISEALYHNFDVTIPPVAWSKSALPDYLKMRFVITAPGGRILQSGRDPDLLHRIELSEKNENLKQFDSQKKEYEVTGLTRWDINDIPETIVLKGKDGKEWMFYPAFEKIQDKAGVNLRLFSSQEKAIQSHPDGVAELFSLHLFKEIKALKKSIILMKQTESYSLFFGSVSRMMEVIVQRLAEDLFKKNIRTRVDFISCAESLSGQIQSHGLRIATLMFPVLDAYREAQSLLNHLRQTNLPNPTILQFLALLQKDLNELVPSSFILIYEDERVLSLPRYIRAIAIRGERGIADLRKDGERYERFSVFLSALKESAANLSGTSSEEKRKAISQYFWLLWEYFVSLFAQELKTPFPVSRKKLEEKLGEINRMG
jgi:ATP-dependent helicase HrpA